MGMTTTGIKIAKERMKGLAKEAEAYAYQLTTARGPGPPAPPGAPPARQSGALSSQISGRLRVIGNKIVMMELTSTATARGRPYPLFLEVGMGTFPHPWLKPTYQEIRKRFRSLWGRKLSAREANYLRNAVRTIRAGFWKNYPRFELHVKV